jgi:hypothetical protein
MTLRAVQRARDFLDATQNSDGGWGYRVGNASGTEPTALAVIARPSQVAWEKGVAWLLRTQQDDGGWGMNLEDDDSNWLTVWATWALLIASTEESLSAAQRGMEWVLADVPVEQSRDPASVIRLIGVDPTLDGWPWQLGGGAWVEPTALSLLVSFAAGITDHPHVREGVAFLRDRVCMGGGWNVGAPFNFGQQMPPTPHCTALTLLVLQAAGADRDDPLIAESLVAMRQLLTPPVAAGSLAWGLIALRAWQTDDASLRDRLLQLQAADGGWEDSPYATASAVLALQTPTPIFSRVG